MTLIKKKIAGIAVIAPNRRKLEKQDLMRNERCGNLDFGKIGGLGCEDRGQIEDR